MQRGIQVSSIYARHVRSALQHRICASRVSTMVASRMQHSTATPSSQHPVHHSHAPQDQNHSALHLNPQGAPSSTPASPFLSSRVLHFSYDITIVGGGMVGSALAAALAASPLTKHLRVCMIESAPPANIDAPLKPAPSIRVSAISPSNALFFDRIGAWDYMRSEEKGGRVAGFQSMQVWHTQERGAVQWNLSELRGETTVPQVVDPASPSSALGFIVENDVIQNSLWKRCREILLQSQQQQQAASSGSEVNEDEVCNLEIVAPAKIESIVKGVATEHDQTTWPELRLSTGQTFRTRLLIGADGPNSIVKKYASKSIDSYGWDYNQRAVVATLRYDIAEALAGNHEVAYQRFLPTGPIALLPCHENYANLVWSTTPAHAQELCDASRMNGPEFVEMVNKAFRASSEQFQKGAKKSFFDNILPEPIAQVASILLNPHKTQSNSSSTHSVPHPPLVTEVIGPRLSFPLRFITSSSYIAPRVALMGDAAHVIHPMAGQGVNLGIGDAEQMLATIEEAVRSGADLGELQSLNSYQQKQYAKNLTLMAGIDSIGTTFGITNGPFSLLRSIGMDVFNAVPALKKKAANTAMGVNL